MRTCAPPISRVGSRRWFGGSQRDERMRTRRWRDGRLSITPPKGVNGRNFPARSAFRRARRSTLGVGPCVRAAADSVVVEELGLLLHDRGQVAVLVTGDVVVAQAVA